ncbi:hypothetical protein [Kitasatospora terrestris]|uniref:Uncharacterized protein n=1 Tax=Kitasatospora terrestris TaxID=258051 RepID=A0ABP9E938_9ACTN
MHAATPRTAVLDAGHQDVSWHGPTYAKGTFGGATDCPPAAQDPDGAVCDRFDLTVDVPAGYWDDNPEGGVPVAVQWQTGDSQGPGWRYDPTTGVTEIRTASMPTDRAFSVQVIH